MTIRTAEAEWNGDLAHGSGQMRVGSGTYDDPCDFHSRMGDGECASPEELLGAAHAGCFSIALLLELTKAGFPVRRVHTKAKVHFEEREGEWCIHRIDLETEARVPALAAAAFEGYARSAKDHCPVSRALVGVDIHLNTKLL
jgi:lipoyl-dependent peroxiredoxin